MSQRKTVIGLAAVLAAALAAGAYGGVNAATTDEIRVALLIPSIGHSYGAANVQGAEDVAAEVGATVRVYDAGYDPAKQNSDCETVIAADQADAIIVNPVDNAALAPCVRAAKDAGIPLVSFEAPIGPDRDSLEQQLDGVTGSVFNPTTEAGLRLAELALEACAGADPCNALYQIGDPAFAYDQILLKGFTDNLDPSIVIVQEVQTNFNPDDGFTRTNEALIAHPDLHLIVTEDGTARGVVRALEQADLIGEVKIVSAGGSGYVTEQIVAGSIVGTVPYLPQTDAGEALRIAVAVARGETPAATFVNGSDLTPLRVITADNADQWTPEYD